MEEELELQDSQQPDQEAVTLEESQPETEAPSVDDLERKNKELFARAKKAEEELKTLKSQPKQEQPLPTNPSQFATKQDLERIELAAKGYSDEEVEFVMRNGGKKSLNDDLVKAAIDARRAKAKSEDATPQSSPKSPVYKKFTQDELASMPLSELEKIIPK
jgi:hypothetical protein